MDISTSPTLLRRMRDIGDQEAWDQFFHLYSTVIVNFCRQRRVPSDLIHDIVQESMVSVLKQMPKFTYDPSRGKFRSFLLRIVDCRMKDCIKRQQRYQAVHVSGSHDWVALAQDSHIDLPCQEWDDLWENSLLLKALERVKKKVEAATYNSFRLYALQKRPITEVRRTLVDRYGIVANNNMIYQHKHRVMELLKKELELIKLEVGE